MFGFFNKSIFIYLLILAIFVLVCSYFWRKVWNMEINSKIMERKISNLKKENSELQYMLSNMSEKEESFIQDADNIMNTIFAVDVTDTHAPQVCNGDKCSIEEISEKSEENTEVKEDIVADITKEIEHESVISEQIPGEYTRKKLSKMNLDKIKEICNSLNLPVEGTKNILIERILSQ